MISLRHSTTRVGIFLHWMLHWISKFCLYNKFIIGLLSGCSGVDKILFGWASWFSQNKMIPVVHAPTKSLNPISSPGLFYQREFHLIGTISPSSLEWHTFIIIVMYYFTKCASSFH
jgi:hypothetical protein